MVTGTTLALAGLSTAIVGVSAQKQAETARRAETRAKSVQAQETARQQKQEKLIEKAESSQAKSIGAKLRASAGRRAGRRSLISNKEVGVTSQLGQKETLG